MIGVTIEAWRAEVGYVLARPQWRRGYMTEALTAVIAHCLGDLGLDRVWGVADIDNHASCRVMERAGMQFEGTLRRWSRPAGDAEPRDVRCYARVRE